MVDGRIAGLELLPRWRPLARRRLTPVRAVRAIAAATLVITLVSGVAMRIVDGDEFPTVGLGLWWAAQTVTSVGYGDVVPEALGGRIVAVIVMLNAIALLTVVTGAITAALLESRRRLPAREADGVEARLDEISDRLARLEDALRERSSR